MTLDSNQRNNSYFTKGLMILVCLFAFVQAIQFQNDCRQIRTALDQKDFSGYIRHHHYQEEEKESKVNEETKVENKIETIPAQKVIENKTFPEVYKNFPTNFLDGCANVYIDVGGNIGIHSRKVLEPDLFPCPMQPVFRRVFGPPEFTKIPGNVCVVGFELNPAHTNRLKKLTQCYTERLHHKVFYFTEVAVSYVNDVVSFGSKNIQAGDSNTNFWGAKVVDSASGSKSSEVFEVRSLNLADFINRFVKDRKLPPNVGKGKVLMKMDIEGAEFGVLTGMLVQGAMCNIIDEVTIEYHMGNIDATKQEEFKHVRYLYEKRGNYYGCNMPLFNVIDDESFLLDGVVRPKECSDIDIPQTKQSSFA